MNSVIAIVIAVGVLMLITRFLKGFIKTLATLVLIAVLYYYLSRYGILKVLFSYMRNLMSVVGLIGE